MKQLTLLFLRQGDEILLAMKKRGFGEGRWNGVGGKLEPSETIEEGLRRECQEEIEVTPLKYEKMAEIIFDEQHKGKRETLQVHVFTCTKWQGEPAETEEMKPKWFNINEIPYQDMWADDQHWLPKVIAGENLKCSFTLDEHDKIVDYNIKTVQKI